MVAQIFLVAESARNRTKLGGDEHYYVATATRMISEQWLLQASDDHFQVLSGKGFGRWSDYRPPGYPMFLAALGVTDNRLDRGVEASIIQALPMTVAVIWLTVLLFPALPRGYQYLCAVVVGVQPWTLEYATSLLPDVLNAGLFVIGAIVLCSPPPGDARKNGLSKAGAIRCILGSLLFTATIWLRSEMYMFCFVGIAMISALKVFRGRCGVQHCVIMALILLIQFSFFVQHRYFFEGRLLPTFVHATPGVEDWGKTWIGSEHERYGIVWGIRKGSVAIEEVPERATSSDVERRLIAEAIDEARQHGYTKQTDEVFARISADRKSRVLTGFILPRAWFMTNLWLNLNTNDIWLRGMAEWPKSFRWSVLGLAFSLKMAIVALGASACLFVVFRFRETRKEGGVLYIFCALMIIIRTGVIGLLLASNEHRYMLMAWPFLLFVAIKFASLRLERREDSPLRPFAASNLSQRNFG